ncbi:MAG: type II toxin-antitoxin system VapB family antitoxin [Desulfobacterales bacterium]
MRTNIDIDDSVLNEAFSLSTSKTKKDLIHEALREFIRLKKRKDLTDLAGQIQFEKNYDHKKMRTLRGNPLIEKRGDTLPIIFD